MINGDKKLSFLSPRKKAVSNLENSSKTSIKSNIVMIFGYFYALLSYFLIKFKSRNKIIICDRYFYQFFFDLHRKKSKYIIKIFPKPDVVMYIDTDLDTLLSRMVDEYDRNVDKAYYKNVLNFYKEEVINRSGIILIDGHKTKTEISNFIFSQIVIFLNDLHQGR